MGSEITVPCGQCIGCKIQRSKEWALRICHETTLHSQNAFLTLTYAPEHMPSDHSLHVPHFQKFMKRYRKYLANRDHPPIRYYHCGEYGTQLSRPHYHAIIFGHMFEDLIPVSTREGITTYTSPTLERLWGKGYVTVGHVSFESAAYVARYCQKKITGDMADQHYGVCDPTTGEWHRVHPEYATQSKGIGRGWYEIYKTDCFPSDFLIHNGNKLRVPKYYEKLYQIEEPRKLFQIKKARKAAAKKHSDNNTYERLAVRKEVLEAKLSQLKRGYEK